MASAIVEITTLLVATASAAAACGPRPEKGWIELLDQVHGFCFWYPPTYKTQANRDFPKDRQTLLTLTTDQPRNATLADKEFAYLAVYLLPGAFNLKSLIPDAPTGYDTPPRPLHFGANIFYYYGPGGGGVAYPDMYYFNLHGRALELVFAGPFPGDDKSPNAATQAIEKLILSSFKLIRR